MPNVKVTKVNIDTTKLAKAVTLKVDALSERAGERAAQFMAAEMEANLTAGGGHAGLSGRRGVIRRGMGYSHRATGTTVDSIRIDRALLQSPGAGAGRVWEVSVGGAARWLNYGRRPGRKPPLGAIMDWLKIRNPSLAGVASGRRTQKSVAFAIQAAIGHGGMAPTLFFSDAVVATRRKLQKKEFR